MSDFESQSRPATDHTHRFRDASTAIRPPDSESPGKGPPDKSQRAIAAAGFLGESPDREAAIGLLRFGSICLIDERKPETSYELFEMLIRRGVPGLCITRQFPDRVLREHGLIGVRIIWLSHTPGEDYHEPTALETLAKVIQKFVEDHNGEGAILLDGLEYLVINNDFLAVWTFVEQINEFVLQHRAILLLPFSRQALEDRELALLERNRLVLRP